MPNKKVFDVKGKSIKGKPNFKDYTHIRAYHACRPVDVSDYYREGIKPLNKSAARKRAAALFDKSIDEIIALERSDRYFTDDIYLTRENKVYFELYKNLLLRDAGHYLCYGSELLACLAGVLDKSEGGQYREILKKTGIPTLFTCDVPIDLLSKSLLTEIFKKYHPENIMQGCWITATLPPECIIHHEHPNFIKNPLEGTFYRNKNINCSLCASEGEVNQV